MEAVSAPRAESRALRGALLVAGLVAAGLALAEASPHALRSIHPTPSGALAFLAAATSLVAVGVPRWAAPLAGGYVFGAAIGGVLGYAAQLAATGLDFFWARAVIRAWVRRRLAGRLARMDAALTRHPFTTTLTLRLLPVGNSLVLTLLAGASGMRAGPFLAGTALGFVPQTVIFALLGSGAHIGREIQLGLAALLFAVSAVLGATLLRRTRAALATDAPETIPPGPAP